MCAALAVYLYWKFARPAQKKRYKELELYAKEHKGEHSKHTDSHQSPNSAKFIIEAIKEGIDAMLTAQMKRKISEQVESMSRRTSGTHGILTK